MTDATSEPSGATFKQRVKTHFSKHAFFRVDTRLSMTHLAVIELVEERKVINIGEEPGGHREHLLFYSRQDQQCFVAIHDYKTKTIITILPVDYHENIAWRVSIDSQQNAKTLVVGEHLPVHGPAIETPTEVPCTTFKVGLSFIDEHNQIKVKSLGSFDAKPYGGIIPNAIKDSQFMDKVNQAILAKGIFGRFCVLMVRAHKNDIPKLIELSDNYNFYRPTILG